MKRLFLGLLMPALLFAGKPNSQDFAGLRKAADELNKAGQKFLGDTLWGLVEASLGKQGKPIEAEDSIIAATAINNGLTLVTGNTKHFDRIGGLKLIDWEKKPPTS